MKAAVINNLTFLVENVIELEEGSDWVPPENCFVIGNPYAEIGMLWDGQNLVKITEEQP